MENKFTIKDMNLYYGSFHALKSVDLNLPANEVTAFIGPSGCGKSTLLRSLNRMNDLVEGCKITGDIRLDNENIYGSMDINLLRKRVGMVFQKANPFPMSIYDNIAYGPRTHGIRSKSKLNEIVEKSLPNELPIASTENLLLLMQQRLFSLLAAAEDNATYVNQVNNPSHPCRRANMIFPIAINCSSDKYSLPNSNKGSSNAICFS